ncbi:MAG: NADH-quinone oxidoreductase subunit A [Proteobacteria bacterium]|nr:NADH-quinone oxidoreductase subunit A [Pseudomonadota bacterium]
MVVFSYEGIFALMVVVGGFLGTILYLSSVLGPRNRSVTKQLPFECGSVSVGQAQEQRFNVRFYLVAMLFILFDIEIIFMYPWAVNAVSLGWPGYLAMFSFVAVVLLGLVYVWRKGVLNWND